MNAQLEKIFEKSPKTKLTIAAVSTGLICLLYWGMFYNRLGDEFSKVRKAIEDPTSGLRTKVTEQEGIRRNLEKFKVESAKLEQELTLAKKELPDRSEIPELLKKVSDKAQDAGLEVINFKPQQEIKHDYYADQPVAVEVTGSFHEIATFFDEVGHLPRIVNIDSFHLKDPQVGERDVSLTTTLTATTFRFLEESERPKKAAEKGAGGKKRRAPKAEKDDLK